MNNIRIRKIIIIVVAFSGAIINTVYGIGLLRAFFNPQYNNAIREILISAIALEFGWAAILLWVVFKPFERRHLLLFTAIPMILGNFLHCMNQFIYSHSGAGAIALNLIVGFVFAGLFVFAFFLGKPNTFEKPNDGSGKEPLFTFYTRKEG